MVFDIYKRDLKNNDFHILDTGHFALAEDGDTIADLITGFMAKHTDLLNKHPDALGRCKIAV